MPEWGWILLALAALGVVDQLAIAAERRGWIAWRHRRDAERPAALRHEADTSFDAPLSEVSDDAA